MRTNVREIRESQGLSMNALAKLAGIRSSHVHYIETNPEADPGLKTLRKVAAALGVTVGKLVD